MSKKIEISGYEWTLIGGSVSDRINVMKISGTTLEVGMGSASVPPEDEDATWILVGVGSAFGGALLEIFPGVSGTHIWARVVEGGGVKASFAWS
jgi:hypothetical protein